MNNFIQNLSFGELSVVICTLLGIAFILLYFYLIRDRDVIEVEEDDDPIAIENEKRKAALAENIVKINDIEDLKGQIKKLEERLLEKDNSFLQSLDRMLSVANEREIRLLHADKVIQRYEKLNKELLEIIEEHLGICEAPQK
jgi:hypothetical protein